jgi:hypothetical protein
MADNVTYQSPTLATPPAGEVIATVEKDSAQHQIVIVEGKTGDATYQVPRLDVATHALETIGYEHHEIHSGSHYFVQNYQDLAQNNVLDFTWLMPNTTKWTHWVWKIATESETLWQFYESAVATNPLANTITIYNNNRNSVNTSGTTMKYELHANLAAANADTAIGAATLLKQGIVGAGKDSGTEQRDKELVLKQNTLYCLRITATAAGYVDYDMEWYEHTDKSA